MEPLRQVFWYLFALLLTTQFQKPATATSFATKDQPVIMSQPTELGDRHDSGFGNGKPPLPEDQQGIVDELLRPELAGNISQSTLGENSHLHAPLKSSHSFDSDLCRRENTFTLGNGVTIEFYDQFCSCLARYAGHLKDIDDGVQDVSLPSCNVDGTWNCKQYGSFDYAMCVSQDGKDWYDRPQWTGCTNHSNCQNACIRFGPVDRLRGQGGFRSVRNCPCSVAAAQGNTTGSFAAGYAPQCNEDGSWKAIQSGYGGNWCVDMNGNPVTEIVFSPPGQRLQC